MLGGQGRKEARRKNDTQEHSPEKNPKSAKSYHSSKLPITPKINIGKRRTLDSAEHIHTVGLLDSQGDVGESVLIT